MKANFTIKPNDNKKSSSKNNDDLTEEEFEEFVSKAAFLRA